MQELIKIDQVVTKETVINAADYYIDKIVNGDISPLAAHLQLKLLSDMIEIIKSNTDVMNAALSECDEYRGQKFGGFYPKSQERKTFQFNDARLDDLNKEVNVIKEKIKERENFLKSVKSSVIDPETGELIEPTPWTAKRYIVWSAK